MLNLACMLKYSSLLTAQMLKVCVIPDSKEVMRMAHVCLKPFGSIVKTGSVFTFACIYNYMLNKCIINTILCLFAYCYLFFSPTIHCNV